MIDRTHNLPVTLPCLNAHSGYNGHIELHL